MEKFKTVILIPALNPDEKMVEYVEALLEAGFHKIVVIDDGSSPERQKYFESVRFLDGVTVLKHEKNMGKGRALKTGFQYVRDTYRYPEVYGVVTVDADGQHCVEDTEKIASVLSRNVLQSQEQRYLVLGARQFDENIPIRSRLGNGATRTLFYLLFGKKIKDTQTGLRGISYNYLSQCMGMEGERYEYEIAMLIQAVRDQTTIREESIKAIYFNRNRDSNFKTVKDAARICSVMFPAAFTGQKIQKGTKKI